MPNASQQQVRRNISADLALAGCLSLELLGSLFVFDLLLELAGSRELFGLAFEERLGTANPGFGHIDGL